MIRALLDGFSAQMAGLLFGDVITEIEGVGVAPDIAVKSKTGLIDNQLTSF
jgi:C-terminal processing protease CtpA/Prc